MLRPTFLLSVIALLSALVLVVLLSGCGGDWYEDPDDYVDYDNQTYQKTLFVYLNVADQDGAPLSDVTVWIDGAQQERRTAAEYDRLGSQFPPDWRGWEYNWNGGPFWYDLRDSGGEARVEIMVSRSGLQTQRTTLRFDRWDPREIYARQTFVMEPVTGVTAAEVVEAPTAPEICTLSN